MKSEVVQGSDTVQEAEETEKEEIFSFQCFGMMIVSLQFTKCYKYLQGNDVHMWGVTGYHGLEPVGFRNYKANAATEVLKLNSD